MQQRVFSGGRHHAMYQHMFVAVLLTVTCRAVLGAYGDGNLRLAEASADRSRGRLEIKYRGVWGTVCDDGFDEVAAKVACGQLGFMGGTYLPRATYGEGQGRVWLSHFLCSGAENRLDECGYNGWGVTTCKHSEDVSVECRGLSKKRRYGDYRPTVGKYHSSSRYSSSSSNRNGDTYNSGPRQGGRLGNDMFDRNGNAWEEIYNGPPRPSNSYSSSHHSSSSYGNSRPSSYSSSSYGNSRPSNHGSWSNWDSRPYGSYPAPPSYAETRPGGSYSYSSSHRVSSRPNGYSQYTDSGVRIVGGSKAGAGRVEIRHNGQWGTVCDDSFGTDAANVVCRQAGFRAGTTVDPGLYGPGRGPIWLANVNCLGFELAIDACGHSGWGATHCQHTEDVGVICRH